MMLAEPQTLESTRILDVRLDLLPASKPLRHLSRVHLHCFASETIAQVRLLEAPELKPGASTYAQLRTAEPLLLVPGDRFIIRQFSPVVTIGGGVVLDAFPLPKQKADDREQLLTVAATGDPEQILTTRITRRGRAGASLERLVMETGWPAGMVRARLDGSI